MYRGLDVLISVNKKDAKGFEKELRKFVIYSQNKPSRVDTVYRAALSFLKKNKEAKTTFAKHFIEEQSKVFTQVGNLSDSLLLAKAAISDHPAKDIKQSVDIILRYPYAAPRAQLIRFFRRYTDDLLRAGISLSAQRAAIKRIHKEHGDSEIVQAICVPRALESLAKKHLGTKPTAPIKLKGKAGKALKPAAKPGAAPLT